MLSLSVAAFAETVSVVGASGAHGTPGTVGTPGGPGSDGEDGQNALAVADAPNENNSATARGGRGGSGGAGGSAAPNSGSDGGDGANGANGGDAVANATTLGALTASSTATAGDGGSEGQGGRGSGLTGSDGQPGMRGGEGGDATSTAHLVTNLDDEARYARQNGSVVATGGRGSGTGVSGGSATATLVGEASGGDPAANATHTLTATATGGLAGYEADGAEVRGGDATAEVTGSTSHGVLNIVAEAISGGAVSFSSEIPPARGSDASATASGIHTGPASGSLHVTAIARPSSTSNIGDNAATASGIATNGASVSVTTRTTGHNVVVRDSVSGSTSGLLVLNQSAIGRAQGDAATTSLTATNPGGGDLTVNVTATAANGFTNQDGGEAAIDFVDVTASGNVIVTGVATGGNGGNPSFHDATGRFGSGGDALIGSMTGRSTGGGDVVVEATATGGSAGIHDSGAHPLAANGDGGGVRLENVVDGETAGHLTLSQIAIAGDRTGLRDPNPTGAPPGRSGEATSRIDRSRSAEHLTVHSEARGGLAEAFARAANDAGGVSVEVMAVGSDEGGVRGSEGGDAYATAIGLTQGDGHAVEVGANNLINAHGGEGTPDKTFETLGGGGLATSASSGLAEGDSTVTVYDRATGGRGGRDFQTFGRPDRPGSRGGDAMSIASAVNAGTSTVRADARAIGGEGSPAKGDDLPSGTGGNATAAAHGESTGGADVIVRAEAVGGRGGSRLNQTGGAGQGGNASITELTGSTAGLLTLQAVVTGGRGGPETTGVSDIGRGGDAHLAIDGVNTGGGDVRIEADVKATRGGRITLGEIHGSSATGDVSIDLDIDADGARFGELAPDDAEVSESISLMNAVSGETAGNLFLRQEVDGGALGGTVQNEISHAGSHTDLALETKTTAHDGANATARSIAVNLAGGASAEADSTSLAGMRAISEATATGSGDDDVRAVSESFVETRSGGGLSESLAEATTTGAGSVSASAEASSYSGGSVVARAFGQNAGASDVDVVASATSDYEFGGVLEVAAEGISTGGGDVSVIARMERSEIGTEQTETVLREAVRGATAGLLELRQRVLSSDGDVRSSLDAENTGGGALDLVLEAYSSRGLFPESDAVGDTILGDVIGRSSEGADVDVEVLASGGSIRMESDRDPARESRIRGISNGGDVTVRADFRLANAYGFDLDETEIRGRDAQSLVMENHVLGSTSGALTLIQDAEAGAGSWAYPQYQSQIRPYAEGGAGGDVLNILVRSVSAESLRLEGTSAGGQGGGILYAEAGHAGKGGDASLKHHGSNSSGSVELLGTSMGGRGGESEFSTGIGGDASIDLNATTRSDGQSILIGLEAPTRFERIGARGGSGGQLQQRPFGSSISSGTTTGHGGDAASRSKGAASGDSTVDVFDRAYGGRGGSGFRPPPGDNPLPTADGGRGGDAKSEAEAIGRGFSRVRGWAEATAGTGGIYILTGGNGGNADALVRASGLGEVEARAHAIGGGAATSDAIAGSAHSRATAIGSSGSAVADAITGSGSSGTLRTAVSRGIQTRGSADAFASFSAAASMDARTADGSAFLVGRSVANRLVDETNTSGSLDALRQQNPNARIEALGEWRARGVDADFSTQTTEFDITLSTPSEPNADLYLAIFDIQANNGGFEELSFRLELDGEAFGEEATFGDVTAARTFFAEAILLGEAYYDGSVNPGDTPAIRAIFEVTSGFQQQLSIGLAAVVVPEPSTALLIGLGLLGFARRSGARSSALRSCEGPMKAIVGAGAIGQKWMC